MIEENILLMYCPQVDWSVCSLLKAGTITGGIPRPLWLQALLCSPYTDCLQKNATKDRLHLKDESLNSIFRNNIDIYMITKIELNREL